MSGSSPSVPSVPQFLGGVIVHLKAFAANAKASPDDVYVRLSLSDGTAVTLRGLSVTSASLQGWGMINSIVTTDGPKALVIREVSVLKVEFQLRPDERRPIGLHSETD